MATARQQDALAAVAARQNQALETRARLEREAQVRDQSPPRATDDTTTPTVLVMVEFENPEIPKRFYECVCPPVLLMGMLYLEAVETMTVMATGEEVTKRQRVALMVSKLIGWAEEPMAPPAEPEEEPEPEPVP